MSGNSLMEPSLWAFLFEMANQDPSMTAVSRAAMWAVHVEALSSYICLHDLAVFAAES